MAEREFESEVNPLFNAYNSGDLSMYDTPAAAPGVGPLGSSINNAGPDPLSRNGFVALRTLPLLILVNLLLAGMGGMSFVFGGISFMYMMQAGVLVVMFAVDISLRRQHKASRARGYLFFYRTTCTLRQSFFVAVVACTALLLVVSRMVPFHGFLVLCVQWLSNTVLLVLYGIRVRRFNRKEPMPDASEEVASMDVPLLAGGGSDTRELLHHQQDLIRFLREQQRNMSQQLLTLQGQLRDHHGGVATADDRDHTLQELRKHNRILVTERDDLLAKHRAKEEELESKLSLIHTMQRENRAQRERESRLKDKCEAMAARIQELQVRIDVLQSTREALHGGGAPRSAPRSTAHSEYGTPSASPPTTFEVE